MNRYTLNFDAIQIDEAKLRAWLRNEFDARDLTIISAEGPGPLGLVPSTPAATAILRELADDRPHRVIDLLSATQLNKSLFASNLRRLRDSGAIHQVRHGVYTRAGAPMPAADEVPPLEWKGSTDTRENVYAALSEPLTAPEVREHVPVTRQRIEQILNAGVERGDIIRLELTDGSGRYAYVRKDAPQRRRAAREQRLAGPRRRLLSALPVETLCGSQDLTRITRIHRGPILEYLDDLAARGLLFHFKPFQQRYVRLTPRGSAAPEYDRDAPKAPEIDIRKDVGVVRSLLLQAFRTIGPCRTRDATDAIRDLVGKPLGKNTGVVVQRLEQVGLLRVAEQPEGKQPLYGLTEEGEVLAAILDREAGRLGADLLRTSIARQRDARADRTRSKAEGRHGSPAIDAIVDALATHGALTVRELTARMTVKFANPKSIYLALRGLADRGVLQSRKAKGGEGHPHALVWSLVPTSPA